MASPSPSPPTTTTSPPPSWFDMTYDERWSPSNLEMTRQVWDLDLACTNGPLLELKDRLRDEKDYHLNHPLELARCYLDAGRNVDKAETKFRAMIEWRRANGMDDLLDDDDKDDIATPLLQQYYPSCFLDGVDKEGDVIWLDKTGKGDCHALLQRYGQVRFRNYTMWIREQGLRGAEFARDYERRHGKPPVRLTAILDMSGLSMRHIHADMIQPLEEGIQILQDYYGGTAKRILVINAPFVFRVVWGIAQHFCNDTLKRTIILCNPRTSQATLGKYIDREVLPPCVCKQGKGRPGIGMPSDLTGGILPPREAAIREHDVNALLPDLKSSESSETVLSCDSYSYAESSSSRSSPCHSDSSISTMTETDALQQESYTASSTTMPVRASSLLRGNYAMDDHHRIFLLGA